MKLVAAMFAALILATCPAHAGSSGTIPTIHKGCPDYRLEGYRVIQICDPDKFAEGDFLSPTEWARGRGGALTSMGGSEDGPGDSQ
jgi:hypothetical protein